MKILNAQKTGSLIATIRKEQNRTQQDLANELGVSSAAISKWERGIGFPDVSLIEPLATSLGITIRVKRQKIMLITSMRVYYQML